MSFRIPYNGSGIAFLRKDKNNIISIFMGRRSRHPFKRTWSIPGGSIEKKLHEDALTGAIRELKEETSVNFNSIDKQFVGCWVKTFKPFFKWTTFFYVIEDNLSNAVPDEFYCLKWIKFKDLKNLRLRPFTLEEMEKGIEMINKHSSMSKKHRN